MTQKIKVACGKCGGTGRSPLSCPSCGGSGKRELDDAMLAELRGRVVCVSGSEVEGLLDLIDAERKSARLAEDVCDEVWNHQLNSELTVPVNQAIRKWCEAKS